MAVVRMTGDQRITQISNARPGIYDNQSMMIIGLKPQ